MYMFIMTNILNHTKFKHIYDTFYERLLPQATQNSREKKKTLTLLTLARAWNTNSSFTNFLDFKIADSSFSNFT